MGTPDAKGASNQTGETAMFRKLVIALGATAVLGAAALAPTSASAFWKGNHWHSRVIVVGAPLVADNCYFVKQTYVTKHGFVGVRYVKVCDAY
jgi:hypothetical protein